MQRFCVPGPLPFSPYSCTCAHQHQTPHRTALLTPSGSSFGEAKLTSVPPLVPTNHVQVVYINTSLKTKALAHAQVPTITCTSSNVVQTVLQAFAQVRSGGAVWRNSWQGTAGRELLHGWLGYGTAAYPSTNRACAVLCTISHISPRWHGCTSSPPRPPRATPNPEELGPAAGSGPERVVRP